MFGHADMLNLMEGIVTTELWMLLGTVGILFVLTMGVQPFANTVAGISPNVVFGNREDMPPLIGLRGRAQRAVLNLIEGLAIFAPLVIIAHVAGVSNELTVGGATLYFAARAAHATIYVLGIPYLRTLAFFAGVIGQGMIVAALLGYSGV